MSDNGQRGFQTGWAMARGEGAAADATSARGGIGPRGRAIGAVMVVGLVAFVAWTALRGSGTWVEATDLEVDIPGDQVAVTFTPPEGCWAVTGDSSVSLSVDSGTLVLDLRVEEVDGGCATSHVFALPLGGDELPDNAAVDQVACRVENASCGDPVIATLTR